MPNIKSAKKRVQIGAVKQAQNKVMKSMMRTSIKKVQIAVAAGDRALADSLYSKAASNIDKAWQRSFHKNNAANKKSSLSKLKNSIAS